MKKIVLTGGPSSGKTSTLEALQNLRPHLGIVPECASLLLGGGYPVPDENFRDQVTNFQQTILQVQFGLESMAEMKNAQRTRALVLDRATLDGVAYWPDGPEAFLNYFGLDYEIELARYSGVLFFELPDERSFGGLGKKRFHNYTQAVQIAAKQRDIWSSHRNFHRVPAYGSLEKKIAHALEIIDSLTK